MVKIEQTFNLEQFSDQKRVGCYLIVAVAIAHLTIGGFLFFTFGWGAAILWLGAIVGSFYLYNKYFTSECTVQTREGDFSVEVTAKSPNIECSISTFSWHELVSYQIIQNKGTYLMLKMSNQKDIEFRNFSAMIFFRYLKDRFPQKENNK